MLAARQHEGLEFGLRALRLAEALDLPDVRIHALANVGSVRAFLGQEAGIADLEGSVDLARQLNSPELARCLNNLGVALGVFGRLRESQDAVAAAVVAADRFGLGPIARFSRANRSGDLYRAGRWDEALAEAEGVIAEAEPLGLHAIEKIGLQFRASIRLARGDTRGAEADTVRMLELTSGVADPQARLPALAARIDMLVQTGREAEARPLAEELYRLAASAKLPFPGGTEAFFVARCVGVDRWIGNLTVVWRTPWLDAIDELLRGDPERAADMYAAMASPKDEAFARLQAGKAHLAAGDAAAAEGQLAAALSFYRGVGATRYVAEAEALLAAPAASHG
jgi:hypothetical protein